MAGPYQDFVPAGEDPGALGGGFSDFVPTPEPKAKPQPAKEQPNPEPSKAPTSK